MHIGLYSPAWPPGELPNGVVTYVRVVRAELIRRGHRVSIFSWKCEDDEAGRVYRVDVGGDSPPLWRAVQRRIGRGFSSEYDFGPYVARRVMRVHERERLDVLEMEESFGWCADVARQTPVPLVVKLHGPAFLSLVDLDRETPERRRRIEAEGAGMRLARAIVAPSRSTMLDSSREYALSGGEVVSIPNPIDVVGDALVWRPRADCADELLFVGRFDSRKGGDAAIQAFARLARSRPRLRLNFVGPDHGLPVAGGGLQPFADYVRTRVDPDITARIVFLGTRPPHEVQQLRLRCAATLVATRWESFGYVVAEAMMQGCPIAAFDVVGVNELIVDGDTGLLAPLDDIDALAAQVARLIDDPQLAASIGGRARASIEHQCGAEAVVERMLELYRRVVNSGATVG